LAIASLVLGILGLLALVFSPAREKARTASCQSNLKQVALALLMYAQDYDGRFPARDIDREGRMLDSYCRNREIFYCPSASGRPGYQFNRTLQGWSRSLIPATAETMAIFESDDGETVAYRHSGGANFAFADGHVKWFHGGGVKEFRWNPRGR
jgi:prepilin-type processing-associated H-X9-DG protein